MKKISTYLILLLALCSYVSGGALGTDRRTAAYLVEINNGGAGNRIDAANVEKLAAVVAHVSANAYWSEFVIYAMKSTQNAGSGSAVYSLGGLTDQNMVIVNGAPWTSTGITLLAASGYHLTGDYTGFESATELLTFQRHTIDTAPVVDGTAVTAVSFGLGTWRTTTPTGEAGMAVGSFTGSTAGEVWSSFWTYDADTSDGARRLGTSVSFWTSGVEFTHVMQFGNDFAMWADNTSVFINKNNIIGINHNCAPADLGTISDGWICGGRRVNGNASGQQDGEIAAFALLDVSAQPTTAFREKLTDLINEL